MRSMEVRYSLRLGQSSLNLHPSSIIITSYILTAETGGALIISVYKPPSILFQMPPLHNSKPEIAIGDFNSDSVTWAYADSTADSDAVKCWAEQAS